MHDGLITLLVAVVTVRSLEQPNIENHLLWKRPHERPPKDLTYLQLRSDSFVEITTQTLHIFEETFSHLVDAINEDGLNVVISGLSKLNVPDELNINKTTDFTVEDASTSIGLCAGIVDVEVQKLVKDFMEIRSVVYNNAMSGSVMTLRNFEGWNPVNDRMAIETAVEEQFYAMVEHHHAIYPELVKAGLAPMNEAPLIRQRLEECILNGWKDLGGNF